MIGVVLALGFLLLLVAFQAPLVAALGVLTNLLSTAAAFGVAKLVFQDGHLAGLLGFESQGFLDAWAPVFFFAMVFAIAMDYTVFLLSSARRSTGSDRRPTARRWSAGSPTPAASSSPPAAVMVAVFFTFAFSARCRRRKWARSSASPLLLDAFLVRLLLVPVLLRLTGAPPGGSRRWLRRLLPRRQLRPRLQALGDALATHGRRRRSEVTRSASFPSPAAR